MKHVEINRSSKLEYLLHVGGHIFSFSGVVLLTPMIKPTIPELGNHCWFTWLPNNGITERSVIILMINLTAYPTGRLIFDRRSEIFCFVLAFKLLLLTCQKRHVRTSLFNRKLKQRRRRRQRERQKSKRFTLGTLSKDVFERRTSTGSEAFSLFICLDANKLVLLSFFSLLKTIYPRVSTKPLPNDAKSPLPVDVRRSKTLLLKLPVSKTTTLHVHHDVLYISYPSLPDYNVIVPNFTFCRGREHKVTTLFFFS